MIWVLVGLWALRTDELRSSPWNVLLHSIQCPKRCDTSVNFWLLSIWSATILAWQYMPSAKDVGRSKWTMQACSQR